MTVVSSGTAPPSGYTRHKKPEITDNKIIPQIEYTNVQNKVKHFAMNVTFLVPEELTC
jgi:hypothetical protein